MKDKLTGRILIAITLTIVLADAEKSRYSVFFFSRIQALTKEINIEQQPCKNELG